MVVGSRRARDWGGEGWFWAGCGILAAAGAIAMSASRRAADHETLRELVDALSEGRGHPEFVGFEGEAVARLREAREMSGADLRITVRSGDAPKVGDGSCGHHAMVTRPGEAAPFIGLRLRRNDGWEIGGYWTP